jgi:hypothetical protein
MPSSLQVIVAAYNINVGGVLQIKTSQHYSLSPASSSSLEAHNFISTLLTYLLKFIPEIRRAH